MHVFDTAVEAPGIPCHLAAVALACRLLQTRHARPLLPPPTHPLFQVAARLVEPLQSNLHALLKHRKYKALAWERAKVGLGLCGREGRVWAWELGRQAGRSTLADGGACRRQSWTSMHFLAST